MQMYFVVVTVVSGGRCDDVVVQTCKLLFLMEHVFVMEE
jgi:hypothetical protein